MIKSNQSTTTEVDSLEPTATLELLGSNDFPGTPCAALTLAIKAGLQELQPGQILLVRVHDHPRYSHARFDVRAWCALTGNVLQTITEEERGVLCFFIRKELKR